MTRRTREIGIRMALGADRPTLLRGVLRGGARMVFVGTALGIIGAWTASRVLATMLYVVTPTDLPTYALVAVATVAVALIACYLPARRASRVDPVVSLQGD